MVDQPLLYTHQYTYFTNALRIAEHAHPLEYILRSDEWRTWDQHWTIAPLYHLFAAAVFRLLGPHLLPLQLLQCLLDSIVAVAVGILGRRVAGPRGLLAGAVYAVYFPAVEMTAWTMTESLHTVLLVGSFAVLSHEAAPAARWPSWSGGFLLGVSALARSVSSAFVGVVGLWRFLTEGTRRNTAAAALVLAGGAAAILPWTARNVFVIGEPVLIETAAFENLWWANNLVDRQQYLRQEQVVHSQPTPAATRAAALHFALRGVREHPDLWVERVRSSFWHFLRPEGLQNLLVAERSQERWRHLVTLFFDDLPLILMVPPFVVFLIAGRPSPTRRLIVLWIAYYLFMVIVIFHNEVRYRSAFVPFAFAGAAGGLAVLVDRHRQKPWLVWSALALGLWLATSMVQPFVGPALRVVAAERALGPVEAAIARGDLADAQRLAAEAADRAPKSSWPWLHYARLLVETDHRPEALEVYRRLAPKAGPSNWIARIALAGLLGEGDPTHEAAHAQHAADLLSWDTDPWLVLEVAWRELPPPHADEILLARGDYAAVRGFLHPRGTDPNLSRHRLEWNKYERLGNILPPPGGHRWTRHRAWLRLVPTQPARTYAVTLEMGVPFPSTLTSAVVTVRVNEGAPVSFTLGPEVKPYTLRAAVPPGQPILVRLDAPTWNRLGEPAEQGVRVDRLAVTPEP